MKEYKLSEEMKESSFKLIKKQLKTAKSYKESPALEYLFSCREALRLFIFAKEEEEKAERKAALKRRALRK